MIIRASILPALAMVAATLLAAPPASAAEKCADQIAVTKAVVDSELDADDSRKTSSLLDYLGRDDFQLEQVEDRLALHRAFSCLPRRERLLMYLRFFENRSQSEVARVLNISQMHVSRLQARSLETMRQALSQQASRGTRAPKRRKSKKGSDELAEAKRSPPVD